MPVALVRSLLVAAALIQRNCTEAGWSFPSPPYYNACELEAIGSNNDTEAKASGFPGGRGAPSLPSPYPTLTHAFEGALRHSSLASSLLLGCLEGPELGRAQAQPGQGLGHHPATSLPTADQDLPAHAVSLRWCFPFQKGYFVTMKVLYTCGYSTSLAALFLAIGIFSCFRKLHCTRNSIHIHFFTSFILRGAAVIIKDTVLFSDESIDHCTMSTVNCKAAIAFFQYSVLANFYWLLVEGMYLQTLLLLTFTSDKRYIWWYILVGWGVPMLTVCIWVVTRLQYDNHGCWDDHTSLYWWVIKAPILLAIFVNFLIFLNVTRMLAQKIRSPDISKNYKQQYMRLTKSTLLLIPLFGVHYVVFALFPEHVGVDARLYFELVLGSYQGFLVALLYCFLNGEVSVPPTPIPWAPQPHTWPCRHPAGCAPMSPARTQPCMCAHVQLLPLQRVPAGAPGCQRRFVVSVQVQAEIKRNWGKWQLSMESNVFNLVTQDFTA
ncbi:hypothetical protein QYF61_002612 [Mycteria americana]|uniref:G-protein coupled receptors family 2 profile 2 domain-containing protein n=1 Tax=Mycteria americana TaxID=33587 RepID=A0AAN7N4W5_MYCAM|nr:hypothetical protein QYF61_002612 [Mycteria americana]